MRIHFEPTSLFQTLIILGMLAGGVGLMARAARNGGDAIERNGRGGARGE